MGKIQAAFKIMWYYEKKFIIFRIRYLKVRKKKRKTNSIPLTIIVMNNSAAGSSTINSKRKKYEKQLF